jgi:hypothetical protein
MGKHYLFKFSVTIHSDDIYIVAALRGLAWQCQETVSRQISWANTSREDWKRDGNQVTFHFTSDSYRSQFLKQARLLLTSGWEEKKQSNDDPARKADSN